MNRYEYKVIDTGKQSSSSSTSWVRRAGVVGVTTKKQLFIAPPQAIILMRELETSDAAHENASRVRVSA